MRRIASRRSLSLRKKTESVSDFTAWDGAPSSTGRVESHGGPLLRIALESFLIAMADDPATINKESTNENNTDVDRWADARRLRINGKPCS